MPKQQINDLDLEPTSPMPNSPRQWSCSICNDEKVTGSFDSHIHSASHRAHLGALFWTCKVCGVSRLKKEKELHEGGEKHSKKLRELAAVKDSSPEIPPPPRSPPQKQSAQECNTSAVKVEESPRPSRAEKSHIKGPSIGPIHNPIVTTVTPCQTNKYVANPQRSISLPVEIDEKWTCSICNVTVSKRCEEMHKRAKKHRGKVKMQPWTCMVCNLNLVVGCQEPHEASKKHRKNVRKKTGISVVPTIDSHVSGSPTIVEVPRTWTCTVCAITIDAPSRESHERGKKHYRKSRTMVVAEASREIDYPVAILPKPLEMPWTWTCKVCALTMEAESRESHEEGRKHRANAGTLVVPEVSTVADLPTATLPTLVNVPRIWTCIVCALTMGVELRESHEGGKKHRSKAGISDSQHWTHTIGNMAVPSGSRVSYEGETQHISKTQSHPQPIEIPVTTLPTPVVSPISSPSPEMWRCTDCKMTIEASNRESHEAENRHRAKANRFPWRNFIRPVTPPSSLQQPHEDTEVYRVENTTAKHSENPTMCERAEPHEQIDQLYTTHQMQTSTDGEIMQFPCLEYQKSEAYWVAAPVEAWLNARNPTTAGNAIQRPKCEMRVRE